jgi:hypothetical protein
VGPYLLPDGLTTQRCRDFLETILQRLLKDVHIAVRQRLRFKHDGAPAHYREDVRQRLNPRCPGRSIIRRGPIAWPLWTPDLSPMDFFLCGDT